MSNLGNIKLSYGKQFNIAIANTYSNIVLAGSNLPANTIIISSNIDDNLNDTGSYSMLATDNFGNPVRLTYCIKQGNGLTTDEENKDVLILKLDNSTLKNNQGIHIDLSSINENNIHTVNNKLTVNNDLIQTASTLDRGIFAIDGKTVLLDDVLYVNTDNLNYANNETLSYGIIKTTDDIVTLNNGVISIDETAIPHADNSEFGFAKGDESTTYIVDNMIQVNTDGLEKANENEFGIISVDNEKIITDEGILSVKTENLSKATPSSKGIISIDGKSIKLNSLNQISINKYDTMMNGLNNLVEDIDNEINSLEEIKNHILSQIK